MDSFQVSPWQILLNYVYPSLSAVFSPLSPVAFQINFQKSKFILPKLEHLILGSLVRSKVSLTCVCSRKQRQVRTMLVLQGWD